jgi:uncharacterized membrane protein
VDLLSRWLHILAASFAVGAFIYGRFVVAPSLATLSAAQRTPLVEQFAARLRPLAWSAIAILLLTGLYNFYVILQRGVQPGYHMVFGIKFLLALHVFGMLFVLSKPPTGDPARDAKRPRLMLGAAISGMLILALGAYLRTLHT